MIQGNELIDALGHQRDIRAARESLLRAARRPGQLFTVRLGGKAKFATPGAPA